jgi:hypothetical protein
LLNLLSLIYAGPSRVYTVILTDVDHIKVRQVKNGSKIIEFSVQYNSLIRGKWRKITRYDNAHGYPHRHVYYPNKPEYKHSMNTLDTNEAFTEAQIGIKKNFIRMKETYIILMRNVGEANHE